MWTEGLANEWADRVQEIAATTQLPTHRDYAAALAAAFRTAGRALSFADDAPDVASELLAELDGLRADAQEFVEHATEEDITTVRPRKPPTPRIIPPKLRR